MTMIQRESERVCVCVCGHEPPAALQLWNHCSQEEGREGEGEDVTAYSHLSSFFMLQESAEHFRRKKLIRSHAPECMGADQEARMSRGMRC